MNRLLRRLGDTIFNLPGWHTSRKIIVFESDDWGMIRTSSKESYRYLLRKGFPVDECIYSRNDILESNGDVEKLFEILLSAKDRFGKHPIVTANTIMANPDFDRIKDSGFEYYFFETFDSTLNRYPQSDKVMDYYKKGIDYRIFMPQLHGREHLNISNWMDALSHKNTPARELFELQMFTAHVDKGYFSCSNEFLDAFGLQKGRLSFNRDFMVEDAVRIFESKYFFQPKSFIAPCYIWPYSIEKILSQLGILYIQGNRTQMIPNESMKKNDKKRNYTGRRNESGGLNIIRNASFEVVENPDKDWVSSCLKQIHLAFTFMKPAVISTHRVNFVGSLSIKNRTATLRQFSTLLKEILRRWPEVEFMSTPELGSVIDKSRFSYLNF